jgi:hypothetical protein
MVLLVLPSLATGWLVLVYNSDAHHTFIMWFLCLLNHTLELLLVFFHGRVRNGIVLLWVGVGPRIAYYIILFMTFVYLFDCSSLIYVLAPFFVETALKLFFSVSGVLWFLSAFDWHLLARSWVILTQGRICYSIGFGLYCYLLVLMAKVEFFLSQNQIWQSTIATQVLVQVFSHLKVFRSLTVLSTLLQLWQFWEQLRKDVLMDLVLVGVKPLPIVMIRHVLVGLLGMVDLGPSRQVLVSVNLDVLGGFYNLGVVPGLRHCNCIWGVILEQELLCVIIIFSLQWIRSVVRLHMILPVLLRVVHVLHIVKWAHLVYVLLALGVWILKVLTTHGHGFRQRVVWAIFRHDAGVLDLRLFVDLGQHAL